MVTFPEFVMETVLRVIELLPDVKKKKTKK